MEALKENIFTPEFWVFSVLSISLTACSFAYFLREINGNGTKANISVFFCSLCSLACTLFYFHFDVYYSNHKNLKPSKPLCLALAFIYQTTALTSRCLCNLIFAFRYKTLNRNNSVFAVKRANRFSFIIISMTVVQTVVNTIYFSISEDNKLNESCFGSTFKHIFCSNM